MKNESVYGIAFGGNNVYEKWDRVYRTKEKAEEELNQYIGKVKATEDKIQKHDVYFLPSDTKILKKYSRRTGVFIFGTKYEVFLVEIFLR